MRNRIIAILAILLLFAAFSFPLSAHAAVGCANTDGKGKCTTVNTAIGPISTDPGALVGNILQTIIGIAGGVAVLLIIVAGYQMMTSQGNPEKVKEARERLISAIVGLLFIFFSITILQIIGIQILQLPGFISK